MHGTRLIVISGAIASGKTTVSRDLARRMREQGVQSAAIDMDDLMQMVMGGDWLRVNRTHWWLARQMALSLVDRLQQAGTKCIFLAGAFFDQDDRDELRRGLPEGVELSFVTLQVPLAEAGRRCVADRERFDFVRDLSYLRGVYDDIAWKSLPRGELVLSTEDATVAETAERVWAKMELP